jgi:hypothetical protein
MPRVPYMKMDGWKKIKMPMYLAFETCCNLWRYVLNFRTFTLLRTSMRSLGPFRLAAKTPRINIQGFFGAISSI